MIEESAVVVAVDGNFAWVDTRRQTICGHCKARAGCGTSVLAEFWNDTQTRVRAVATIPVKPGDSVIVGLEDGALLRGALLVYLLPLVLLLAGGLLGKWVFAGAGDEPLILTGILGLVLGLWVVRILSRRIQSHARFQPVILRHRSSEYKAVRVTVSCQQH
ncbi:MAG: Fis family transcriptional regulator [Candidatus Contendobacter odensis]|uniref:Fis family transcriptional regulator n=1 Tax=Candidatus Contendibacter odensensis TaxID=1400860 RepID=A0A2G6PEU1_9GAMM|nr:MAG: Fis family transcriptional regulator [Candidatus Contendobacter odensis]